jgi:hypothetical protein
VSGAPASRVVVALDAPSFGDLAIEIAREIAKSPTVELLGIFVEDARLLEHARAPLAREIAVSGRARPLDESRLERALRAQATLARGIFEEAAARAGLRHTFQVARGALIDELLRAAADAEAVIVALGRRDGARAGGLAALARARLRALLFTRENEQTAGAILAVVEAGGTGGEPLRVAARLAQRARLPLRVLLEAGPRAEDVVRAQIAALHRGGIAIELLPPAAELTPDTIARHARDTRLSIVPARGAPRDEPLIEHLLAKTRAALLLIREE